MQTPRESAHPGCVALIIGVAALSAFTVRNPSRTLRNQSRPTRTRYSERPKTVTAEERRKINLAFQRKRGRNATDDEAEFIKKFQYVLDNP